MSQVAYNFSEEGQGTSKEANGENQEENNSGGSNGNGQGENNIQQESQNNTENNNQETQEQNNNTQEREYDDEKVLGYFKSKGREISSIDDLFKVPEPEVKEVNPYENISDKAKAFLEYHKNTGRDFEDYLELHKDVTKIPVIDLAREKVRNEMGANWSNEQIDMYLEKKLGIDLQSEELDVTDQMELTAYTKDILQNKLSEQEKYKMPLENKSAGASSESDDFIQLETGERVPKAAYEQMAKSRQDYLDSLKVVADKITASSFQIKLDNNGVEQTKNYGYEYSVEDKHKMLSDAENVSETVGKLFNSENGFNHQGLVEGLFWMNPQNREKAISAMLHKALAERTEELLAEVGNVKLGATQNLNAKEGSKAGASEQPRNSQYGVKYDF